LNLNFLGPPANSLNWDLFLHKGLRIYQHTSPTSAGYLWYCCWYQSQICQFPCLCRGHHWKLTICLIFQCFRKLAIYQNLIFLPILFPNWNRTAKALRNSLNLTSCSSNLANLPYFRDFGNYSTRWQPSSPNFPYSSSQSNFEDLCHCQSCFWLRCLPSGHSLYLGSFQEMPDYHQPISTGRRSACLAVNYGFQVNETAYSLLQQLQDPLDVSFTMLEICWIA